VPLTAGRSELESPASQAFGRHVELGTEVAAGDFVMTNLAHVDFRRLITLISGLTVLLIGIAMIVLPGPAFVVIPAGLAILATKYRWASVLLAQFRALTRSISRRLGTLVGRPAKGRAMAG